MLESLVTGSIDGWEARQGSSARNPQFARKMDYLGLLTTPQPYQNRNMRLSNGLRTDLAGKHSYLPGKMPQDNRFAIDYTTHSMIGTSAGKPYGYATRSVVAERVRAELQELGQIQASQLYEYHPEHPDFPFFNQQIRLVMGRFMFLEAIMAWMEDERPQLPWITTWSVLVLIVDDFHRTPTGALTPRDTQLLSVLDLDPMSQRAFLHVLAPQCISEAHISQAHYHTLTVQSHLDLPPAPSMHGPPYPQTSLPKAPKDQNPSPASPAAGGAKGYTGCVLCSATDHQYSEGHYDHPTSAPITSVCKKKLEDGKICGLKHARTGPLATACRQAK